MSPTKPMTITLDEVTRELLDRVNTLTGASRSEVIRRGVALYVADLERAGFKVGKAAKASKARPRKA